ncbi:MAG: hypothetical protein K1X29_07100 [Bdellovibrionales bacterium]|nr:hypothetical protein [Bdellovibrionales bacterium]
MTTRKTRFVVGVFLLSQLFLGQRMENSSEVILGMNIQSSQEKIFLATCCNIKCGCLKKNRLII